ncbi:peptidase S24/S26A/S26B/S26C [Calycina marina]|uniref:Mitochondrial inner membrane protease subunit 2 n=1 Tax=Calycina marina TaxID=1763456 RepID=A0A9P8CCT7_9HELO|nr:peptidase S24/S26A/S26B/S26C [Calycina marina]
MRAKLTIPNIKNFSYGSFIFLSWVPAMIFFNTHVGEVQFINGESMYPYLNTDFNETQNKTICWTNKWKPTKNLQRGMIVSLWSPYNPDRMAIKRVVGLEGDMVYTRAPYPYQTAVVPKNHVWVEGDNRDTNKTMDSNTYGPVALPMIQGRITHILSRKGFGEVPWWQFKGKTRVVEGRKESAPHFD